MQISQISEWEKTAEMLFFDDFSDETSGWDTYQDDEGWAVYHEDSLQLSNYSQIYKLKSYCAYSCAHQYYTDFILEVDTTLIDGSDNNWHDVQVRMQDTELENYYSFSISADGFFSIDIWKDGEIYPLAEPTSSIRIKKGYDTTNTIRVECIGNTFTLMANGYPLRRITDGTFQGGDIALAAHSCDDEYTTIAFDNIRIIGHRNDS